MKRLLGLIITIIFIFSALPITGVNAIEVEDKVKVEEKDRVENSIVKEKKLDKIIDNWIVDEERNKIYAYSSNSNYVYVINGITLEIDNTIDVQQKTSDIILEDGKLYAVSQWGKEIKVIDVDSLTIVERINIKGWANSIVKNENTLYYYSEKGSLYKYNMDNHIEEEIKIYKDSMPNNVDMEINKEQKILYLGNRFSNKTEIIYYSINENKIINSKINEYDYLMNMAGNGSVAYNEKVYFDNRQYDSQNSEKINGIYNWREDIKFIKSDLVFTDKGIYNKDKFNLIGSFYESENINLITGTNNTVYTYSIINGTLKRYNNNNIQFDSNNIIDLFYGTKAEEILKKADSYLVDERKTYLDLKLKLSNWVLDEKEESLLAIPKEEKAVLFINANTLNLEDTIMLTAVPTGLITEGDELYIWFSDIKQIVIIDINNRIIKKRLHLKGSPMNVVKLDKKLYYNESGMGNIINEVNLDNYEEKNLCKASGRITSLAINKEKNILYLSGADNALHYYSLENKKIISMGGNDYNYNHSDTRIIFDGQKVYYAGRAFHNEIATRILGKYEDYKPVVYVNENFVYTKTKVYNKNNYGFIEYLEWQGDLIATNKKLDQYLYKEDDYGLIKIKYNFKNGDINKDGLVDIVDISLIANNYNEVKESIKWKDELDINKDSIVDIFDLIVVSKEIIE